MIETKHEVGRVTENLFMVKELTYNVKEVDGVDEEGNPTIETVKTLIETKYIQIKEDTDITKFEKFIQDQITTYRADKE